LLKKLVFIFILAGFFSGCAMVPSPRISPSITPSIKEVSLQDLCNQYQVAWQWDSVAQTVMLTVGEERVKLLVGSNIVLVEERVVGLSEQVRMVKGEVRVPADFEQKIFRSKYSPAEVTSASARKGSYALSKIRAIIIDAGHGGKDPGATGRTGVKEKHIVLDIAKRLAKILKKEGVNVKMTRNRDNFISLKERTVMASQTQVDLFISIHANSSPARRVQGIEVYTLKNLNILEKNEEQRQSNYKSLFKKFSMKQKNSDVENILEDLLSAHKQAESKGLAEMVSKKTAQFVKGKTRGVKEARFYVLRNTLIPAILVEVGFLSNPREERLLKTKAYRQRMAEGLAKSILEYVR